MKPQPDLEIVVARLQRLERRQRATAVGWALTVAALAVVAFTQRAWPAPQFVDAHAVRIVDGRGRPVLMLGSDDAGRPGIWFLRPGSSQWAMRLGFTGGTPAIALQTSGGQTVLGFSNNFPIFLYRDAAGSRRFTLDFEGGDPEIVLYDKAKKIMWRTP
jgi:hypothetical protein